MQDTATGGKGKMGPPERPYLKPWYRLARPDGRLVLEYAQSAIVFEGKAAQKLLPVLLPLLDGTRTVGEINAHLGDAASAAVAQALEMLSERGVLTDGPPLPEDTPMPRAETAQLLSVFAGGGRSLTESEELLDRVTVSVLGEGATAEEIARQLRLAGVTGLSLGDWQRSSEGSSTDLAIAAPEPHELPRLEQWNRRALDSRSPWLQVLPFDGRLAAVGPLYVPGETCCYECFRRRRAANVAYPAEDHRALESSPASYPSTPPLRAMTAGLAAMLALRWLSDRSDGGQSGVPGTTHAIEWGPSVELSVHRVYRVPRCPICFPDDLGMPTPWHG